MFGFIFIDLRLGFIVVQKVLFNFSFFIVFSRGNDKYYCVIGVVILESGMNDDKR